jgi:hypothetical protein
MGEIIDAIILGIPYASIVLTIVCTTLLYGIGIVGARLVSTNYKVVTFLYFLLTGVMGFVFLSYVLGAGV